jgi:hypothetical protein
MVLEIVAIDAPSRVTTKFSPGVDERHDIFGKAGHVDSLHRAWGAFADHHAWDALTAA